MANFIGLVYATLKNEGIDTSGMSTDEAVDKYNELKGSGKGTPAEQRKVAEDVSIDNIYSYLRTKPSEEELYATLDRLGINKSGIDYYDTIAPMKSLGERANLIDKIYSDKDFRK